MFEGTTCPICGNAKGNIKLAPDGIEQEFHTTAHLFNETGGFRATDELVSSSKQLERKRQEMQMAEIDDNLRQAVVLKSKLGVHDLEMQEKRKQAEAKRLDEQTEDYLSGKSIAPPIEHGQRQQDQSQFGGFGGLPLMPSMSPQAVFMQQLMKMDSAKRGEFMQQIADADPVALANLAAMFPSQQQPQSIYGPNRNEQYGYPPPWWLQQQQSQQPQTHQTDPIALVTSVFDLVQKLQPQKDNSNADLIKELREDSKRDRDKLDAFIMKEKERPKEYDQQRAQLVQTPQKSLTEQITELTSVVKGLEEAGLVTRHGATLKSVDDELKLKEFDLKKDTQNRELDIQTGKIKSEQDSINLKQSLVSSLLKRGIEKGRQAREEENPHPKTQHSSEVPGINRVRMTPPVEIISQITTENGIISETRRPVKRTEPGSAVDVS